MRVNSFLDWIAGTVPWGGGDGIGLAESGAELSGAPLAEWVPSTPRHGYKWAYSHPDGFEVMAGRADMGTHLIAPGHALRSATSAQINAEHIVKHIQNAGGKLTRIDVAVDASLSGLDIFALAEACRLGDADLSAKKWSYVRAENGGQCLYVGARVSERFLRVYDKASELMAKGSAPDVDDYKRIELEAKGMAARAIGQEVVKGQSLTAIAVGFIREFADFPHNREWSAIMLSHALPLAHSHRTLRNTERWLLGVVAKTLAKQMYLSPEFKTRFEASVRSFYDDLSMARPD